jgi:hypothetical protein
MRILYAESLNLQQTSVYTKKSVWAWRHRPVPCSHLLHYLRLLHITIHLDRVESPLDTAVYRMSLIWIRISNAMHLFVPACNIHDRIALNHLNQRGACMHHLHKDKVDMNCIQQRWAPCLSTSTAYRTELT